MKSFVCDLCGYVYFTSEGEPLCNIAPGTPFENLPDTFICPICAAHKGDFFSVETSGSIPTNNNADLKSSDNERVEPPLSQVWLEQLSAIEKGEEPPLPDFSWAGYHYSEVPIPEATGKIFDVTTYGAGKSSFDRDAVIAAIADAEKNGGGIVYFPPGKYFLNEEKGKSETIFINGANIVLKGAGANLTEIYMREHLEPVDPNFMWMTPSLFTFQPANGSITDKKLTSVTKPARRETFQIAVADSSPLAVGMTISLYNRSPKSTPEFLDHLEPWSIWTSTTEKGPLCVEKHKIAKIENNLVTLCEPLHVSIDPANDWQVWSVTMREGWRVEDISFRGKWKETLVHHKNYIHDSGWSLLVVNRGDNVVMRNLRFIDVNTCINLVNCFTPTVSHTVVEGNRGHCFLGASGGCYGALFTYCADLSAEGMWHGPGANKASCGTVIHRYEGKAKSGPDFHASWPYCTLVDASSSGLVGNGGAHHLLPNHGRYLVWWNHCHTGEPLNHFNFFEERRGDEFYSNCKAVSPWLIGYHNGAHTTFDERSTARVESLGKKVSPESLFEAQLAHRTGRTILK